MSNRENLRKELKKDSQLFWAKLKSSAVKFASTVSIMTSMFGAPQMAGATERVDNDNPKEPQEYFDKYKRIVDYQVDTVDNDMGVMASYSSVRNLILENYYEYGENDCSSANVAHEVNHRDIHMSKLRDFPMSLEQKYKIACHNEISSFIITVMQTRQEYIDAKTDEEREKIMSENSLCDFYFEALKEGKITNKHSTVEEFDAEMKFIAQKMQKMVVREANGGAYDEQMTDKVKLYLARHDYDFIKHNDEGYNAFVEYAYNIGGIDFRKYLDDIECNNDTVLKADEMIRNNVPRAQVMDTIMTNEEYKEFKIAREDDELGQEFYNDFASIIKPNHETMSLEQAVTLKFDKERAEDISEIVSVKKRYFEAQTDKEREKIGDSIDNYFIRKYYDKLVGGEIDTVKDKLSKDDLDYINNMAMAINPSGCVEEALHHYQIYGNTAVRNDENFLSERSQIYTFDGVDYSHELTLPKVNITGINVIQADAMIKDNAGFEDVRNFLKQSGGYDEMFYIKGEVNQNLSPDQQIKIEEHRLFLQNLMCRYGYGETENFAKNINDYIDFFKEDLTSIDGHSNYLQICLDIASNVEKNNGSKRNISKDNDDLYKQELAKVYMVNGVNLLEHINGDVEDILPKFSTLDGVKEEVSNNLDGSLWKRKRNVSENDVQYYRYKEDNATFYYGDPIYFEWSEDCRVSGVQQIEIYDFKSNILKDQRNMVELRELMTNSNESSQKFDKKVDERSDSKVAQKSVAKDCTNVNVSARLNVYEL